MQITVTVRDADEATLNELAEQQWRDPAQQASALLEQALRAQRARSDPSVRTSRSRSRPRLSAAA